MYIDKFQKYILFCYTFYEVVTNEYRKIKTGATNYEDIANKT